MLLTVGEISKALGISVETIRYYVDQGLINPRKNEQNNYWEYSSEDLIRLTDIMFYRSMGLNMKEIKLIMNNMPLTEIGSVIESRKSSLIKDIRESMEKLWSLNDWEGRYKEELNKIGAFRIGDMRKRYRRCGYFEDSIHMAKYLSTCFDLDKEDWGSVSISFDYDLNDDNPKLRKYLTLEDFQKIRPSNTSITSIEEKADNCLITEVYYSDNVMDMIKPIITYADANGYKLKGKFYGRENTNYFVEGKRRGLYEIFAPIK